jgi:hypothetical protein
MIIVEALAYVADVWVIGTYVAMVAGRSVRAFHWANAVGAIPIAVTEVAVGAWQALVLTMAFGIAGAIGVWQTRRRWMKGVQAEVLRNVEAEVTRQNKERVVQ